MIGTKFIRGSNRSNDIKGKRIGKKRSGGDYACSGLPSLVILPIFVEMVPVNNEVHRFNLRVLDRS